MLSYAQCCLVHLTASILVLASVRTAAAGDVGDYGDLIGVPYFDNQTGGNEFYSLIDETATLTADIAVTQDNVRCSPEFRLQPLVPFRPISISRCLLHLSPLNFDAMC